MSCDTVWEYCAHKIFKMASGGGTHSQREIEDGQIDYCDIMVIGKTGMGKTTTADKLLVANPQCRNYQGDQHSEPDVNEGCVNVGDLSIWLLSNAPDELERVKTRLKNIVFFRSLDNPHNEINGFHSEDQTNSGMTLDFELISNESTKIRVLDVPGFFGEGDAGTALSNSLEVASRAAQIALRRMRNILRLQSEMKLKFRRILYFLPMRGALSRSNAYLEMELTIVAKCFGKAIFDNMVVITTISPEAYDDGNKVTFSEKAMTTTKKYFNAALALVFPDEKISPQPSFLFVSMADTCETILANVKSAHVACDFVTLQFNMQRCARCGSKVKTLESQQVSVCTEESSGNTIFYNESTCHPLIIPKYWKIMKVLGGMAHVITAKRYLGRWPNFCNPDDEICVNCGALPGTRGCLPVNTEYEFKGGKLKVDHKCNPDKETVIEISDDDHQPLYQGPQPARHVATNVSFVDHYVLECNFSGIEYTNKKHNFSLHIPEGAIPMGENFCFEIAIAMHGPFILPKDTRLISPILWLCPREKNTIFKFNKPFRVVIPHTLHKITEEKAKGYQLGFAKANHRNISYNKTGNAVYNFQPLPSSECNVIFSSTNELGFGTATMSHFCYLCITATNMPELKSDIGYCLTRAQRPVTVRRHEVCFCVSYCLGTCIEAIREQFKQEEGYALYSSSIFKVSTSNSINILVQDNENCVIARTPQESKILISDVDFQAHQCDENFMRLLHNLQAYPPRVSVSLDMTTSNTICLRYNIEGTDSDQRLSGELLLPFNERVASGTITFPVIQSQVIIGGRPFEVSTALRLTLPVASDWKVIGALLGIPNEILSNIASDEARVRNQLLAMLNEWSRRRPPPTWEALAEAVEDVNPEVAERIRHAQ